MYTVAKLCTIGIGARRQRQYAGEPYGTHLMNTAPCPLQEITKRVSTTVRGDIMGYGEYFGLARSQPYAPRPTYHFCQPSFTKDQDPTTVTPKRVAQFPLTSLNVSKHKGALCQNIK